MNAWGGLRQKASLPTMSLVGISVVALLVASTVTADASPHTNIPVVTTVANAVHASITGPISSFLGDTPSPKPPAPSKQPKVAPGASSGAQQSSNITSSSSSNSNTTGSNAANATGSTAQSNSQSVTVAIAPSALQCTPNSASSPSNYTLSVLSAQVNFQTPPTAGGTITYAWDVQSSNGQVTTGATASQQQFSAGQTSVTLSPPTGSQSIYTTTSGTSSLSFRLHITGPFEATSTWISVPSTPDGSCPPSNNN
jgi:hypothetical protein